MTSTAGELLAIGAEVELVGPAVTYRAVADESAAKPPTAAAFSGACVFEQNLLNHLLDPDNRPLNFECRVTDVSARDEATVLVDPLAPGYSIQLALQRCRFPNVLDENLHAVLGEGSIPCRMSSAALPAHGDENYTLSSGGTQG